MANERAGEEGVCHAGEATLLAVHGHPRVPEVEAGHVFEAVRVVAPVLGGRVTVEADRQETLYFNKGGKIKS